MISLYFEVFNCKICCKQVELAQQSKFPSNNSAYQMKTSSVTRCAVFLFTLFTLSLIFACAPPSDSQLEEPINILFIGDSFTSWQDADLPSMFSRLAELGKHEVNISSNTRSATSLAFHSRNKVILDKIRSGNLDFVVLQETEKIPTIPEDRDNYMFPVVRNMTEMIQENGAITMLYMTWGYKEGFPAAGHDTYASMQAATAESNQLIAEELDLPVSPVGIAWQAVLEQDPEFSLWVEDGGHPTPEGMFLSANVFYAVFFGEDPSNLPYSEEFEIDETTTRFIQQIAAQVVLENSEEWNLPLGSVP
jgi:lysophospholipase L1-like esterase